MKAAKLLTALGMPVVVAALCGGILSTTHHTQVPRLALPPMPTAAPSSPGTVTQVQNPHSDLKACRGKLPHPFAGIAVRDEIPGHIHAFKRATGAHLRVIEFYNHFPGKFQRNAAEQVVENGAVPMIQLNPRNVNLSQIASGYYDTTIEAYATAVKSFACHVILSFGHEMNGWWYSWGLPTTAPALYKLAWQHIFDIFKSAGVTNVIWSWDPTHQHLRFGAQKVATPASEWYPGNKYVNIVGIDGYLNPGQNFAEVFQSALADIRSVADKPIFIAETGVAPGLTAPEKITQLFAGMRQYRLQGVIWFEQSAKKPWPLEGRPAADRVYHNEVAKFPR